MIPAMRAQSLRADDDTDAADEQFELQERILDQVIDIKNEKGIVVDHIQGSRFRF